MTRHRLLCSSFLLLAAALRFWPLLFGQPVWHPDEFNFVYWPLLFFDGDLNPNFYYYPHFHYYVLAAVYAAYLAVQSLLYDWSFSQTVAHYYFWQTADVLWVGRLVSAALGVGTVVWLALVARRVYGETAALAAVAVISVRLAPLAAADVPMTFWFVAAVWASLRLLTRQHSTVGNAH